MLTATFTLTWPDGAIAQAQIRAESAQADYPVRYTGEVGRLVGAPAQSDEPFLRFKLQNIADTTGAEFEEDLQGTYDRYAQ